MALRESTAKWKVVVGHHPIKSDGHHGNTPELVEQVLPILQVYYFCFCLANTNKNLRTTSCSKINCSNIYNYYEIFRQIMQIFTLMDMTIAWNTSVAKTGESDYKDQLNQYDKVSAQILISFMYLVLVQSIAVLYKRGWIKGMEG